MEKLKRSGITIVTIILGLWLIHYLDLFPTSSDHLPPSDTLHLYNNSAQQWSRVQWVEKMHQVDQNADWQEIEYINSLDAIEQKKLHPTQNKEHCSLSAAAENQILGSWVERGSVNQAGSVLTTTYLKEYDEIWLIAAGGSLWKTKKTDIDWQVVNDSYRFNGGMLHFVPHDNSFRLIALINRIPHYSDDFGKTWTSTVGIEYKKGNGHFKDPISITNGDKQLFFLLVQPELEGTITLYVSKDKGENFVPTISFGETELSALSLVNPLFSSDLFVMKKGKEGTTELYEVDFENNNFRSLSVNQHFIFHEAPSNIVGWKQDTTFHFYAYTTRFSPTERKNISELYYTTDFGQEWTFKSFLPQAPFEVGLFISPSNPELIFSGGVDCFYSDNGGNSWKAINHWLEYYNDIERKLHADIMHFGEYVDNDEQPFQLFSHHGGLHISYDQAKTLENLSMNGLNITQYYSVISGKNARNTIYAGSQDQGFQLNISDERGALSFEQTIIGDFGHLLFSKDKEGLWAVYPGGTIVYIDDLVSGNYKSLFSLPIANQTVWLPPITLNGETSILLAGGSLNADSSSHIIELSLSENKSINATQIEFDFKEVSNGGDLSALAVSPLDPKLWYAATSNGYFFSSENGGVTWDKNESLSLNGNYLYGQAIFPSRVDKNRVILGGSGYSNAPVFISNDKGNTFTPMDTGLPPTLVYRIDANTNESVFFAATEAGPFAFVPSLGNWYPLNNGCAPNQTYWSVEWIESEQIARFGTFGRGIWDFEVQKISNTNTFVSNFPQISIFPNPTSSSLNIDLSRYSNLTTPIRYAIFNSNGQRVLFGEFDFSATNFKIDLETLPSGQYYLSIISNGQTTAQKFIKTNI